MTYNKLLEILLDENVYKLLKENELEIFKLIPELEVCKGFNQNNKWHIYDVYEHILHVILLTQNNKCLKLSAFFHDIGKPLVYTESEDGVGHFYNHWNKSIEVFNIYKNKFNLTDEEVNLITNLIYYHDINIDKLNIESKKVLVKVFGKNIDLLFYLKKADLLSQSPEYHYLLSNIDDQKKKLLKNNNYFE